MQGCSWLHWQLPCCYEEVEAVDDDQVDATALGCLLDEVVLLESSVEEKLATGAAAVDDLGGWGSREEERAGRTCEGCFNCGKCTNGISALKLSKRTAVPRNQSVVGRGRISATRVWGLLCGYPGTQVSAIGVLARSLRKEREKRNDFG